MGGYGASSCGWAEDIVAKTMNKEKQKAATAGIKRGAADEPQPFLAPTC